MSKNLPLISVIMPVLDNEKYLSSSVQSILNQSFNNIELIIIDDSKNDYCYNIIKAKNDTRIIYLKGPKRNLSCALNLGIERAKGDYIARMDSDDIALPNRLSMQIEGLEENQWQICGTWIKQFGSDSRIYTYPVSSKEIKYWMMFTCAVAHPTVMGYAEVFRRFKYNEDSRVEDHELWTRMLRENIVFGNIDLPLLKYRRHQEATTSKISQEILMEREIILKDYAQYLFDANFLSPYFRNSCGTSTEYSLEQIKELCEFIHQTVQLGFAKKDLLLKMLPYYFRKTSVHNLNLLKLYLKLINEYRLPLLQGESLFIALISIFKISRNSKLYFFKRFISLRA